MRREELFQMLPMPRKRARRGVVAYKANTQFSFFSQMKPRENTPVFSRRKGASAASAARCQSEGKEG